MFYSFGNLLNIKRYLDPSSSFSWGTNPNDSWVYFKEKEFESIFYLNKNGKIRSICFWDTGDGHARYVDHNNPENINVLLEAKELNLKLKEWILFNLDSIYF